MWRWGREYGGHTASCMIGSCLSNRVKNGWGSWLEVIDRIYAFSAQIEMPLGTPEIWSPEFVRLLHEVQGIHEGSVDYCKGGLYFCDTRRIETEFFKTKILANPEDHPRCCDLNTLTFFR